MSIDVLLKICQWGMFLTQWVIIFVTSTGILQCKMKNTIKNLCIMMVAFMCPIVLTRVLLAYTKSILINTIICMFVVIMFNILFFEGSLKKKAVLGVMEVIITLVAEAGTAGLLLSTANTRGIPMEYGYDSMYAYPEYVVLSSIYSTLLLFVIFMVFFVLWKGIVDHFWMKEYLLYVIVPFYQLILIFIYYVTCREIENIELTTGILLVGFSLIIDFSIIYLVNGMLKKMQVERELAALYAQRQTEMKYYEMAMCNMEEMKKIRHDFGDRLKTLYALLEQGEHTGEVKEILDTSSENLKNSSMRRYCENSIVNAILSIKMKAAKEKQIDMVSECSLVEEMGIEMIDLCSLFANLIDNAIEACEKVTEGKKQISMRAGVRSGYLIIKIENTYLHPIVREKGKILTSKLDSSNHGYGLKLIDEIVKKYSGSIKIETQNDVFKVIASLKVSI